MDEIEDLWDHHDEFQQRAYAIRDELSRFFDADPANALQDLMDAVNDLTAGVSNFVETRDDV